MVFLGIDIGSSSIKATLLDGVKGVAVASASYPVDEMVILSKNKDWAEQDPEIWMEHLKKALQILRRQSSIHYQAVGAIGITYQMHGLVLVDREGKLVRNSIIWCDSRAGEIGEHAFHELGEEYCLKHLLNSPGNFTASKLRWVQLHEPRNFERVHKLMLPGDYMAYRLTGEMATTASGLSEGILWDFSSDSLSNKLLEHYQIPPSTISKVVDTFSIQGHLSSAMANELGLKQGIPVAYRAGDQPNNAFSLNVLEPGEIAATAGTSGVIYGVSDQKKFDPLSRVNTFLHVNHTPINPRQGILLCINSTGILNSWAKHQLGNKRQSYDAMNEMALKVPAGAEGLMVFPFGNGSERILQNKNIGATISGINFNIHTKSHLYRAMQEGIIFALYYGLEIMREMGMEFKVIRAGNTNMFLSPIFRQTLADISGATIELYNTNGAEGAARGAGLGVGFYQNRQEVFRNLRVVETVLPQINEHLHEVYFSWKKELSKQIENS